MAGVCVPASGISRSTNDTLGVNPAPPNSAAAPDRVPFGGPAPAAPRFSATRCVALLEPKGTRPGERQNVGRLASECSENQSARSEPAHARRLCHGLLATAHVRRWGSCGGVHVARGPPGAFSVPCKIIHESQPPRATSLACTAPGVRDWTRCAFAASHEHLSRERRSLPLALRFCQSVGRQKIKSSAPGTASSL